MSKKFNSSSSFNSKVKIHSSFFNSEKKSIGISPLGSLNLFFPRKTTVRGLTLNTFTSYVNGYYEVYSDNTVDIRVTVSIKTQNTQKRFTLSYLYKDTFSDIKKSELLINPALGLNDYSSTEPLFYEQDRSILKDFKLKNLKIGNSTKLFIYITLPIGNTAGNDIISTDHEVIIKKK